MLMDLAVAWTHMFPSACFYRKENIDSELKWPFTDHVSVTLLNQLDDANHHEVLTTAQNTREEDYLFGAPEFIPHYDLSYYPFTNTEYLKDGTLYFRVSVNAYDHKPWLECTV